MKAVLLAVFACTVSVALVTAAPLDSYHGDSVVKSSDVCLWLCNQCFGTEVNYMLACVNKVCLNNVAMGKPIGRFWMERCPDFQMISDKSQAHKIYEQ